MTQEYAQEVFYVDDVNVEFVEEVCDTKWATVTLIGDPAIPASSSTVSRTVENGLVEYDFTDKNVIAANVTNITVTTSDSAPE
jgi:hypothetical protein